MNGKNQSTIQQILKNKTKKKKKMRNENMKKISVLMAMLIIATTVVYAKPSEWTGIHPPEQDSKYIWKYIQQNEKSWLSDDAVTYNNGGGSCNVQSTLSEYYFGNYSYLEESEITIEQYNDNKYVLKSDYDELKKLLGQWQSEYYKLSDRVSKLEKN